MFEQKSYIYCKTVMTKFGFFCYVFLF